MTPADVLVRLERPGEAEVVADVGSRAFGDLLIGRLIDELRASWAWIPELSFVAEDRSGGGEVVGHVMFTRAMLDASRELVDVLVLSPLSVIPEHHGRGIGSTLVRQGLSALAERTEPLVFLEGSPGYYGRLGFEPAGPLGFRRPSLRIPEAAFQVHRLAAYQPRMTGTLVYPDVFWRLDCVGLREA